MGLPTMLNIHRIQQHSYQQAGEASPDTLLVIHFQTQWLRQIGRAVLVGLDHILDSLQIVTNNHTLLGLIMALGLGVGIGVTIFQTPDVSTASSDYYPSQEKVSADHIQAVSCDYFSLEVKTKEQQQAVNSADLIDTSLIGANQLIIPSFSGQLDQSRYALFLKGRPGLHQLLKQLSIGDQLEVQTDNNLLRKFTVIEIRQLEKNQIKQLLPQRQQTLVLYASTGLLSDQYLALVARR
jgi:hypothetical protein